MSEEEKQRKRKRKKRQRHREKKKKERKKGKETHPTEVAHADLDGHARAALVAPREVVGQPRDVAREARVDGARDEEHARVHDARPLSRVRREAHGEPDDHDAEEADDEGAAPAEAVRQPREDDGEDGGRDVDGHRQQLRRAGGVAQVLDDGGEEETDPVEGADDLQRWICQRSAANMHVS